MIHMGCLVPQCEFWLSVRITSPHGLSAHPFGYVISEFVTQTHLIRTAPITPSVETQKRDQTFVNSSHCQQELAGSSPAVSWSDASELLQLLVVRVWYYISAPASPSHLPLQGSSWNRYSTALRDGCSVVPTVPSKTRGPSYSFCAAAGYLYPLAWAMFFLVLSYSSSFHWCRAIVEVDSSIIHSMHLCTELISYQR